MKKAKENGKCKMKACGFIGLILMVVGLYSIVLGFKTQFLSGLVFNNWAAMLYYLVGLFLIMGVKMHMCKAHTCN